MLGSAGAIANCAVVLAPLVVDQIGMGVFWLTGVESMGYGAARAVLVGREETCLGIRMEACMGVIYVWILRGR